MEKVNYRKRKIDKQLDMLSVLGMIYLLFVKTWFNFYGYASTKNFSQIPFHNIYLNEIIILVNVF